MQFSMNFNCYTPPSWKYHNSFSQIPNSGYFAYLKIFIVFKIP